MINIDYLGLKCGVCGEDFKKDDDVVVCPECGTPSHRTCYKDNKGCPNADKHGEDFVFDGFEQIKNSARGVKEASDKDEKLNEEKSSALQSDSSPENDVSASGGSFPWVSVRKEIPCPHCGEMNKVDANYCNRCGAHFQKIQPVPVLNTEGGSSQQNQSNSYYLPAGVPTGTNTSNPLGGIPADTLFEENVTAADLVDFVSVNAPYYMRAFDLFKRKKKKFNFSACVFSGIWFLYRKQYKIGSLIFSIEMLLYAVRFYVQQRYSLGIMNSLITGIGLDPEKTVTFTFEQYMKMSDALMKLPMTDQLLFMVPSALFFLQVILMIVCGSIANKMYYKHCIKRIRSVKSLAKKESLDPANTAQALYLSGGVNPFVAGAFGLLYLILFR